MRQLEIVPTFVTQLDGKILPNAHAIGDVDGDDATELIFGSITGDIAIYKIKADRLVKWRSCTVDGSVTSICIDAASANDARVFVATAEGSCFVVTESGDEFRPSSEFRVSLNVCDLAVLDGNLVVGTRDGGLYIYRADSNALGGYKQLEKFEIKREIESFQHLATTASGTHTSNSSQLVVRCTSGEFFQVVTLGGADDLQKKRTVQVWKGPHTVGIDDEAAYIVDGVRGPNGGGDDACSLAMASLSGTVSVFNAAHEKQWSTKLSEAIVALDKLSISSPFSVSQHHDALVACTWGGRIFVVANPDSVVHFRILYPASFMLCADVFESSDKSERVLVAISTSGVIFMFRHLEDTLARALSRSSLDDTIHASELFAQIDSEKKRSEIITSLLQKAKSDEMQVGFFLLADLLEVSKKECPTVEDIVRLAVSAPTSLVDTSA
ncbi:hypothetical protein Gpo141_00002668 [Globisporangium polare]